MTKPKLYFTAVWRSRGGKFVRKYLVTKSVNVDQPYVGTDVEQEEISRIIEDGAIDVTIVVARTR